MSEERWKDASQQDKGYPSDSASEGKRDMEDEVFAEEVAPLLRKSNSASEDDRLITGQERCDGSGCVLADWHKDGCSLDPEWDGMKPCPWCPACLEQKPDSASDWQPAPTVAGRPTNKEGVPPPDSASEEEREDEDFCPLCGAGLTDTRRAKVKAAQPADSASEERERAMAKSPPDWVADMKNRAALSDAREALREQWEGAHFDHCTRLGSDGECPKERCMWPKPAILSTLERPHSGERGVMAELWLLYLLMWNRAPDGPNHCVHCGHEAGCGHAPGCTTARIEKALARA